MQSDIGQTIWQWTQTSKSKKTKNTPLEEVPYSKQYECVRVIRHVLWIICFSRTEHTFDTHKIILHWHNFCLPLKLQWREFIGHWSYTNSKNKIMMLTRFYIITVFEKNPKKLPNLPRLYTAKNKIMKKNSMTGCVYGIILKYFK